ncbi:MAG: aromatic ring-hydroxylating dioxygenase subunit alpha [Myxococcota bacterium]
MFAALPGFWTPAAFGHELRSRPLQVTVAGEKLALFRDRAGVAHALLDRCPHRGVSLSLGEVTADGCLQCPFHGWRFAGDGACTAVPMNPDAKRDLLAATAIPTREIGGLVWVFTDPDAADPGEPNVPELLTAPGVVIRTSSDTWACHWTRAMENMLDVPHLPYVHRATIGRGFPSEVNLRLDDRPTGFHLDFGEGEAWLEWSRPNGMVLNIGGGGRRNRQHVWCVPADEGRTRMMVVSAAEIPWALRWVNPLLGWFDRRILGEDRAVVESSGGVEVPPAGDERSVETDRPTLRFRAWYRRTIADRSPALAAAATTNYAGRP